MYGNLFVLPEGLEAQSQSIGRDVTSPDGK